MDYGEKETTDRVSAVLAKRFEDDIINDEGVVRGHVIENPLVVLDWGFCEGLALTQDFHWFDDGVSVVRGALILDFCDKVSKGWVIIIEVVVVEGEELLGGGAEKGFTKLNLLSKFSEICAISPARETH